MLNPFEPGYFDDPYTQYRAVGNRIRCTSARSGPGRSSATTTCTACCATRTSPSRSGTPTCRRRPTAPDLQALDGAREQRGNHTMLNLDPPDHHRLRRLVSKVFTPRMIEGLTRASNSSSTSTSTRSKPRHGRDRRHRRPRLPAAVHHHLGDARHPGRRRPRAAPRVVRCDREGLRPDPHARGDAGDLRRERRDVEPGERAGRPGSARIPATISSRG